jgi:hypothetical protein
MKKTAIGAAAFAIIASAQAYTYTWKGTSGDWNTAVNWSSNIVPAATNGAVFTNGAAPLLSSATNSVGSLAIAAGANRASSVYMLNSKLTTTGTVHMANGNAHNSTALLSMTNSELTLTTLTVWGQLNLGGTGTNQTATLQMKDSKLTGGYLYVGGSATDAKSYLFMDNSTASMGQTTFANSGARTVATVALTNNSSLTSSGSIFMGNAAGSVANVSVRGGSSLNAANFSIASGTGATTTVSISDSSSLLKTTGTAQIGLGPNSYATVDVSGDSLAEANALQVGAGLAATGTFNAVEANVNAGSLSIGFGTNSVGLVNIGSGASLTSGLTRVGYDGKGTLNLNGGRLDTTPTTNNLVIAGSVGDGTVIVSNGATVSVAALNMATGSGKAVLEVAGADNSINVSGASAQGADVTFIFEALNAGGFSTVNSSGDININGAVLQINLNGHALREASNLYLFSATNAVSGTFSSVIIDGASAADRVVYGDNYIKLLPEPAMPGLYIIGSIR